MVLVDPCGLVVSVDPMLLLARLRPADHPTGRQRPTIIRLARENRLGTEDLTITHPQESEALFVQVSLDILTFPRQPLC